MKQSASTDQNPQLAAIYCRVSSERQEKEGTIQSQLAELENIAKENGDVVSERYLDDGYSGELLERPALDKLRSDARRKTFYKLYILTMDRLARKHHYAAIILEDLARSGIKVVFANRPVGDSVEDRLLFDIQSVFADYEKAKILDRLRRGKIFKIKKGSVLGNVPPYGYRCVKDSVGRRAWYAVDEQEAEVVRFIFSFYTGDKCSGLTGVRRELNRRGIKNRHDSSKWSQSMIARILTNETYIGTTHWGKYRSVEGAFIGGYRRLKNTARIRRPKEEWLPVKVPPILSEDLFLAAGRVRASNKQLSCANVKYNYLLKGLMRCSWCDSLVYAKSSHGTGYYVCGKRRSCFPDDELCKSTRHLRSAPLDDSIWDEFRRLILSPDVLLERIREKNRNKASVRSEFKGQVGSLETKISMLREKRSKLIDAYTNGAISVDELKNRTEEFEPQIKLLQSQRSMLDQQNEVASDDEPEANQLARFAEQIKDAVDSSDFVARRQILRHFIRRVTLSTNEAVVSAVLPRALSCVDMSRAYSTSEQASTLSVARSSTVLLNSGQTSTHSGKPLPWSESLFKGKHQTYAFEFVVNIRPPIRMRRNP